MNGTLVTVMLPSKKNNTLTLPADTGEGSITRRRKNMCAGVSYKKKKMEEKLSLEKLHFRTLHSVPPTFEIKPYTHRVFLDWE